MRGAAAGERIFLFFFDPDETGDLAGGSREPRKFAKKTSVNREKRAGMEENGKNTGNRIGAIDREDGKWARIAQGKGDEGSKWVQIAHTRHRRAGTR